jgi:hypothetical protein
MRANAVSFADGNETGATVALLIHRQDEGAIEWGSEERARSVAEVMIELKQAAVRAFLHQFEDAEIIQLAAQLAEGFALIITARDRRQRGQADTQERVASPGAQWATGDGNDGNVAPTGIGTVEAIANGGAGYSYCVSSAREFAFFDRCFNSFFADQASSGIVRERR